MTAGARPFRILLVEDDQQIGRVLEHLLTGEGFAVDWTLTGTDGLRLARAAPYDGLVLDLTLGDMHGIEIVRELRREGHATPILVLTGDTSESTTVQALDAGADEYVLKPFRNRELVSRVRALVRRRDRPPEAEELVVGGLVLNRLTRRVATRGTPIGLSPREFSLLEQLMLRPGRVVPRGELLEHAWNMRFDPRTNVLDVHILRLRRKLRQAGVLARLETVRGQGIMLIADEERAGG